MTIAAPVRAAIVDAADEVAPREACGVLLGRLMGDVLAVREAAPARNRAVACDRFELESLDLLAADERARGDGLEIVGVWHSHPRGDARPSAADRSGVWDGWLQVIVGLAPTPAVRAWQCRGDAFVELVMETL